ncbi:MAG: excinuclease subunit UvrA [Bacteroidota bacterium]|jgi:excinuclease ABC subunit A|nr:excinuclease ABC subunit UvrA [Bacteroidota bacterium]
MSIRIQGARVHNLKGVDVEIPKEQLTVVTGLSGSGKSSLAFDTLYAEGQRRYVESLSSYARQFLGRLDKPDVDRIDGLSPAVAIEQRSASGGPRSTVGTRTEIHDHLRMLFARIGETRSPVSGEPVRKDTPDDVVKALAGIESPLVLVVSPWITKTDRSDEDALRIVRQQGFTRVWTGTEVVRIEDVTAQHVKGVVIDRFSKDTLLDDPGRVADSVETAFFEGQGRCWIIIPHDREPPEIREFNDRFERDGITFPEPHPDLFSFNSPAGACARCEGYGHVLGIDPDKVIPDPSKSIYDQAVAPWRGERTGRWREKVIMGASAAGLPIHAPWHELNASQQALVWNGCAHFRGISDFFAQLEAKSYKIQNRVMISRYRGKTLCPSCEGTRLGQDAHNVYILDHNLPMLLRMPVSELLTTVRSWSLTGHQQTIAERLLWEIDSRLQSLEDLGLGYLTLLRSSPTLSGGESQRIALSTCVGSSLVGSTYVLDEPSIGLHPEDTSRLIGVLQRLRNQGNTVVVVEHDDDIVHAADHLIDMGPLAGSFGGEVVFSGTHRDLISLPEDHPSLSAAYRTGRMSITVPMRRRILSDKLSLLGVRAHNLRGFDVDIPLHGLVAVTGVSGSGKSTLVTQLLVPAMQAELEGFGGNAKGFRALAGDVKSVAHLEFVDQHPLGKSSRSNPVTYVKAFDEIRNLLADTAHAKARALKPSHFSFNVSGGRCETCEGEGHVTVGMQFMADLYLTCESCGGKRFQDHILDVKYDGMNVDDMLRMTVDDALLFFAPSPGKKASATIRRLLAKLQPLADVGLGYVTLGQGSNTLSGGEAQRIKLAAFLSRGDRQGHTLFVFDEPTTGLHVHDVAQLLRSFEALIAQGHSVVVIEHHLDVIKCADWVIDLGPGGGIHGGNLVHAGTPESLIQNPQSVTGKHLAPKLDIPS